MQQPSETDLLVMAQAGDMEAFADLQVRLEPVIRRFVWRLIGTSLEEEDIIQDSMIALYLNLARVQPVENLRAYLFRIVRNRCYDLLRKRRRFQQLSLDEEPMEGYASLLELADDDGQPEDAAHWLLLNLEVQKAMNRLPEHQRQTLILYAEENLSYPEIASAMNTSVGTVKSRLFHARRMLRGLLHPDTLAMLEGDLGAGEEQARNTQHRDAEDTEERGAQNHAEIAGMG